MNAVVNVNAVVFILTTLWISLSTCQFTTGDLRLTGRGSSPLAGRLEIYHNGVWGTVCARRSGSQFSEFNFKAATVACRQLGLGWAVEYYSHHFLNTERGRFGIPSNSAHLDNVRCDGHEPHLLRCRTGSLGNTSSECDPDSAVSITCSNLTAPYNGQVMLIHESLSQSTGVLRLHSNYQWGLVCSSGFTMDAAHAVCHQLGFTSALSYREVSGLSGPFWNVGSALDCDGSSTRQCFTDCLSPLPLETSSGSCMAVEVDCTYTLSEANTQPGGNVVRCHQPPQTPQDGDIRLSSSSSQSTQLNPQGRLEIYFNGAWGTVCDESFLYKEADVVCKSHGFPSALSYGNQRYSVGGGSGVVYTVTCSGLEERVADCTIERAQCSHDHDVDVKCSVTNPPYGALALRSGRGAEGTLFAFTGEFMTPLCDLNFEITEANVACRQLGYPGAVSFRPNGYYRGDNFPDTDRYLYNISSCRGDESYLLSCPSISRSSDCRRGLDEVALVCGDSMNDDLPVRLVDGPSRLSGRLEVKVDGMWGAVCHGGQENRSMLSFDRLEGHVVCQQLGYGTVKNINFNRYSGAIALSRVSCSGFEESVLDCKLQQSGGGVEACREVVMLECTGDQPAMNHQVSLIDRNDTGDTSSGRLEITYLGLNMSVCGLLFTRSDAQVVCRELGFARMVDYCTDSCYGEGDGYIHLAKTRCSGSEDSLSDCDIEVHHPDMCTHSNDVGIVCEGTLQTTQLPDTPAPTSKTGFPSIYIYVISGGGGGALLLVVMVTIVCCVCVCYVRHKKRKNQGTWRSPTSAAARSKAAAATQHPDHPKLNNYIQNNLSEASGSGASSSSTSKHNDYDDPTEALEMKRLPNADSSAQNLRKGKLLFEELTSDPSSTTLDSGYGVSNNNITGTTTLSMSYGPESPPPNYDELDLLPAGGGATGTGVVAAGGGAGGLGASVNTSTSSNTASGACGVGGDGKKDGERDSGGGPGGYQNLSFRSKDGGDVREKDEEEFS